MSSPSGAAGRRQWAGAEGPALVYRDGVGAQQFVPLEGHESLTIGRGSACDVRLPWDERVSRVHAGLHRVGPDWTLVDDGLSRNGTFLNGERLNGRRRLHDDDTFVIGSTSFRFRDTTRGNTQLTKVASTTTRTPRRRPTSRSPTSCSSASTR
jgi:pSer/pThr/pTyr-binding forkhead associated (FHA) protein